MNRAVPAQAILQPSARTAPLVSVIINTYNYGHLLAQAIDTALNQTASAVMRHEVIVVDDGSTDGTAEVLKRYAGRITAICQRNAGQAAAINAGVRACQGEILCFLDADDYWSPDKLAAVVAAFQADARVGLVYHRLQPVLRDGTATLRPLPRALCRGDLSARMRRSAGWWPFPMTSAVSVRREIWDEIGAIPEQFRISADAWLVGIYPLISRVAALPQSLGYYRIHANNWHRGADDAAMLRRRISHWQLTLAQTNQFLAGRGLASALRLQDHLPCRVAEARLKGVTGRERLAILRQSLTFRGEPNLARRLRDSLRLMRQLGPTGLADAAEVSK